MSRMMEAMREVVRVRPPNEEEIRLTAYYRWLNRGQPEGSPDTDWLAAESQLLVEAEVRAVTTGVLVVGIFVLLACVVVRLHETD